MAVDGLGEFGLERPAAYVHFVGAVVEGFAGAVAAEPMPVIWMDIVDVLVARGRALPEIPVEILGDGRGLSGAHGKAGVGVPGLGHIGLADVAVVDLLDHFDGVVGGALLVADLDALFVFFLGGNEELAFAGVLAGGLFDVDMLSGLEAEDGQRGVPVIGSGDGDGVNVFGLEHLAEVLLGFGRVAQLLLGSCRRTGRGSWCRRRSNRPRGRSCCCF